MLPFKFFNYMSKQIKTQFSFHQNLYIPQQKRNSHPYKAFTQMLKNLQTIFSPLSESVNSVNLQHCDQIKVSINVTGKLQSLKALLIRDSPQLYFQSQNNTLYDLDKKAKMIPKFEQKNQGSYVPIQIQILDKAKNISVILSSQKQAQVQQLYNKLKRVISHQGFNDYYKPLKRLGRGTFATVYLIQHKFTKERKAAKVFSHQGQKIQFKGKEALENEIKILREVDHSNLIRYDGIYETDNLIYLVTQFLSGGTLEQTMRNKAVHTGEFISKIIKDILEGLKYLDRKQIMHRDIKPENIIHRKQTDEWVLSDFGLAAKSNQNYIYDKCGTLGYIAPQIMKMEAENPVRYTQKCDIYSLGVISYTLIIGSLPFHVQSQNYFDKKVVWDLFDKPQCKELDPQILKFLQNILKQEPKDRFNAQKALQSAFFTDNQVIKGLYEYHQRRRKERMDRILKIANYQY